MQCFHFSTSFNMLSCDEVKDKGLQKIAFKDNCGKGQRKKFSLKHLLTVF